jgi:hypothetical protein
MRKFAIVATVLFAVSCKGGSLAGTYTLDKAAMDKAMDEQIAKLPADKQEGAKFGKELMKLMDIKMTLNDGGKGEMATTMPSLKEGEKPKTEAQAITWEKKDDKVTISDGKKPITCSVDGSKLTCGDKDMTLVFVKG